MTNQQILRVVAAMNETQQMLAKFETAYGRRPEHLRTNEDRKLIDFYRNHAVKLAAILTPA